MPGEPRSQVVGAGQDRRPGLPSLTHVVRRQEQVTICCFRVDSGVPLKVEQGPATLVVNRESEVLLVRDPRPAPDESAL
jgi:hypothetical protein